MKIQKISHCWLLVEIDGAAILTDPGNFSTSQNDLKGLDAILITHEHQDHLHVESVAAVLKNNPSALVIANSGVGKKLDEAGIPHTIIEGRGKGAVNNVTIEAFDCKHEEIFEEMGQVQNTAYLVGEKFFIPGDAFFAPEKPVEVLALPVAGPWCRLPDALRYAIRAKPAKAFPIHEGMLKPVTNSFMSMLLRNILKEKGDIVFVPMADGATAEF